MCIRTYARIFQVTDMSVYTYIDVCKSEVLITDNTATKGTYMYNSCISVCRWSDVICLPEHNLKKMAGDLLLINLDPL